MSLISRLLFGPPASAAAVLGSTSSGAAGIVTAWATDGVPAELQPLVYADIYGATGTDAVTRDSAMRVAPIHRGRDIIVSKCADLPIMAGRFDGPTFTPAGAPAWATATGSVQTAWHRMAMTLDDLLFYGWSLWVLERDGAGTITAAGRIARARWAFDENTPTGVSVDGMPVTDPADVCLFAGPSEGLLIDAADEIRGWRRMAAAWVGRVRNPIPLMTLDEVTPGTVTDVEAARYVRTFANNRASELGAVGFLPATLKLSVYGNIEADLFDKGRNSARIDIANHLGLPVSLLDGSPATASLTYATQEGTHSQLVDDLEMWLAPIEARLSMDDMTPAGQVARFNRANLTDGTDYYGPAPVAPAPTPPAGTPGVVTAPAGGAPLEVTR